MKNIIQLLPDHIANQIAAGEVVQRPSSVVKELLENAVDSRANRIDLIIKDAGKTLVQVIDNGVGMNETDARLAFERHATSKIRKAEDLFNLHTKGFRGEALASITAVAQVHLKTRMEENDLGTQIVINGSKVEKQDICQIPKGTSIAVKNLFFNVPARRNFLKSNQVETRHIIDEFQRVALTHPDIEFSFTHNDNSVYHLPATHIKRRLVNVFGNKTQEKLITVEEQNDLLELNGYLGKPQSAKKTRGEQFIFVNDRFIKSAYLGHSINKSYENLIPKGYYPSYFLYLKINPEQIDVNIHPTKTEIKFQNEAIVYSTIKTAIKKSLGIHNISGTIDFDLKPELQVPYSKLSKPAQNPNIKVDPNFNPFKTEINFSNSRPSQPKVDNNWSSIYDGISDINQDYFISHTTDVVQKTNDTFVIEEDQKQAFEEVDIVQPYQVHSKYILVHIKNGFLWVNQNRASQRVVYEKFKKIVKASQVVAQKLLFPFVLTLNKSDFLILKDIKQDLQQIGFHITNFENENITFDALPNGIKESQLKTIFEDILENVKQVNEVNDIMTNVICKSIAKSTSINKGVHLTVEEMNSLINQLFACCDYLYSPFGKKIFVEHKLTDIDKQMN